MLAELAGSRNPLRQRRRGGSGSGAVTGSGGRGGRVERRTELLVGRPVAELEQNAVYGRTIETLPVVQFQTPGQPSALHPAAQTQGPPPQTFWIAAGASVDTSEGLDRAVSLATYADTFAYLALVAVAVGALLLAIAPWLRRRMH